MKHDSTAVSHMLDDDSRSRGNEPTPPAPRRRLGAWIAAAGVLAVVAVIALMRGGDAPMAQQGTRPTPVRAAAVTRGDLAVVQKLPGEIVGEAAALSPRVGGRLESVAVRPGDAVRRGDVVATIDAAELERDRDEQREQIRVLEADLRSDEARLDEAASQLERARALFADNLISAQEMDRVRAQSTTAEANLASGRAQVEQARARLARLDEQLSETSLRAPFTGSVAVRYLDPGAVVQVGTPVVRLVQDRPLLVQFRVPERLLGQVAPGASFTLTTQATGARSFAGHIARIAGEVSRSDRTALAEGDLDTDEAALHPGMYADVEVVVDRFADAVLIPAAAIVERLDAGEVVRGVFTVPGETAEGQADWRPVAVLGRQDGTAAVRGEVEAGDRVLTLGHEELADGSAVRVVEGPGAAAGGAGTASSGVGR